MWVNVCFVVYCKERVKLCVYSSLHWNQPMVSCKAEMKRPTEGAPVLLSPHRVSRYKILHHSHCTPYEAPQQPIITLQEPQVSTQMWWGEQGAACRGLVMEERAQSSSVFCKWFFNLRKWKLMEHHSALSAGHINRTWEEWEVFSSKSRCLAMSVLSPSRLLSTSISKKPPLWSLLSLCPRYLLSPATKQRSHWHRQKSVRLR